MPNSAKNSTLSPSSNSAKSPRPNPAAPHPLPSFSLSKYRNRRILAVVALVALITGVVISNPNSYEQLFEQTSSAESTSAQNPSSTSTAAENSGAASTSAENPTGDAANQPLASDLLAQLAVKGRAPKTGYTREEFYKGWPDIEGCSLRQRIIKRELGASATLASDNCTVLSGEFTEPYTGAHLKFSAKSDLSKGIQIDHVVALSDAWQKGAQSLDASTRFNLATDPLNLLAVDAKTNQGKSDGDAATWLPPNKSFRCAYVARQISVKYKYTLWVTEAERDAMSKVLESCPNERSVGQTL